MLKQEYIKRIDFPEKLPNKKTFYCLKCKKIGVKVTSDKKEKYFCKHCKKKNSRCLIFDPKMMYSFDRKNNLVHYGGGMFIVNKDKKILLFLKRKYPYLYAVPGGHLTFGENPKKCALRETKEEVGLDIKKCKLIFKGLINNDPCPGGADIHYWYLYKASNFEGNIILDSEGSKWKWFSIDEINMDKVTYPVKYFLTNKNILSKILM